MTAVVNPNDIYIDIIADGVVSGPPGPPGPPGSVDTVNGLPGPDVDLEAADIPLNTSGFNSNFDSTTTNLQIMADLLDGLVGGVTSVNSATGDVNLGGVNIPLASSGFTGFLDNTIINVQLLADKIDTLDFTGLGLVDSVNGDVGNVVVDPASIGALDKTADANIPGGFAPLNGSGIIADANLPVYVSAVNGEVGAVTLNSADIPLITGGFAGTLVGAVSVQDMAEVVDTLSLSVSGGLVNSVNGQIGTVTLTAASVSGVASSAVGVTVAPLDGTQHVPLANLPTIPDYMISLSGTLDGTLTGKTRLDQLVQVVDDLSLSGGLVNSVNGKIGTVTLTYVDVGAVAASGVGAANGVASLDGTTHIPDAQIPSTIARVANVVTSASMPAQSVLVSVTSSAPTGVVVAEQTIVGRATGGNVGPIDANGTTSTLANMLGLSGFVPKSAYGANTILIASSPNTPIQLNVPEGSFVGRQVGNAIGALTSGEAVTMLGLDIGEDVQAWSQPLDDVVTVAGANVFSLLMAADDGSITGINVAAFMRSFLDSDDVDTALDAIDASKVGHTHVGADITDLSTLVDSASLIWTDDFSDPLNLITFGTVVDDGHVHTAATIALTAADIAFTPQGSISSTNVQAAIQEVRDEVGSPSLAASAISFTPDGSIAATDVQAAIVEVRNEATSGGAPTSATYLVATTDARLTNGIAVGTTPGGELGGSWASPTVDTVHSGSSHASIQTAAQTYADTAISTAFSTAIGSTVQAFDSDLAAIAGLSRARGDLIVAGASAWQRLPVNATAGTLLQSNGTDPGWVTDLTMPTTTYANNTTRGHVSTGAGFHVSQVATLSAAVSGGYLGSAFDYFYAPTITTASTQTAGGWFGPLAAYNFRGTATYSANQGFDYITPIAFGNFHQSRNNAGVNRVINPAWGFMNTPMFVADGAVVTSIPNDTTKGSGGFIDTTLYVTNNGGTWNGTSGDNEATSFISAHQAAGNVTMPRWIGYDQRPQKVSDPLGAGTAGYALIGTNLGTDFNILLVDQVLPTYGEEIAYRSQRMEIGAVKIAFDAYNSIRLFHDTHTHDETATKFVVPTPMIYFDGVQTLDFTAAALGMMNGTGTIRFKQTPNPFGGAGAVGWGVTVENDPSVSGLEFGYMVPYVAAETYRANTHPLQIDTIREFHAGPVLSTTAGGTLHVLEFTQISSIPIVNNAGVTVDLRRGMHIGAIGGTLGTITRNVGIEVDALTRGTTNIGILNNNKMVNTGTIYGSEASDGNLTFAASTAAEQGSIRLGIDGTNASGNYITVQSIPTISMNAPSGATAGGNGYVGFSFAGTYNFLQEANAFVGSIVFQDANVYKTTVNSTNLHAVQSFLSGPSIQADGATGVTGSYTGFNSGPTATTTLAGGTITLASVVGFQSGATVRNGATVTERDGIAIGDVTLQGNGAVTTNVGIRIYALTSGGTNYGIINASSTIVSGGLYGGTAANDSIVISSSTNAAKGGMQLDAAGIEWQVSNYTATATPFSSLWNDATTTMNVAAATYYGVRQQGAVVFQQDGNALGGAFGFVDVNTYKNLAAGSATPNIITSFYANPTLNADNVASSGTITIAAYSGFTAGLTTSRTTAGALSITNGYGLLVQPSVGALTTMVTYTGYKYTDIGGSGTKTTQYAIDIPALSNATNNWGIRCLTTSIIGPTLYASQSASGDFVLRTTTDSTKGVIRLDNPSTEFVVTDFTATANPTLLFADANVTMNIADGTYRGIQLSATVLYSANGNALGGAFGISETSTYKNTPGSSAANGTMGPIYGAYINPTAVADNVASSATITLTALTSVNAGMTTARVTAGNLTVTQGVGVAAQASVGASTTMTAYTGFKYTDIGGLGTRTLQIAMDIPALANAATNIGFRNAATTVFTPPSIQNISAAGNTVGTASTFLRVVLNSGPITLTSNPNINTTGVQNGQILIIENTDTADNLTFTDGNGVQLAGGVLALGPKDTVGFIYNGTEWLEIFRSNN